MEIVQSGKRISQTDWMVGEYRRPLTDVVMREHEIIISLELPDVREQDILVNHTPEGVEIWARKSIGDVVLHSGYYRFIPLQHTTHESHASFQQGILELRIPMEVIHARVSTT
jgi:HSP20 family molecular chaperone IbpA